MRGELRGIKDQMDHPIFMPSMQNSGQYDLDGSPILFPLNGSIDESKSLLITGAWNKLLWSIREDVTYKVLTEAVIQDPATGDIVYNLAQQDMVALRVTFRIAWVLPNPVNRVNTNNATRYPFAVLTPGASS
jgi:HK97 family phage major capsid protein